MMKYKPSQAYYKEFTTSRFSSGAAYDATGTPVATANKNGTDDAAFALTVTNIDTGRNKITGTVPSGYADGDIVNVTVAATVDGVAAKANVDTFLVVTSREADIYARVGQPAGASVSADVAAVKGDTAATLSESQSHPTLAEIEATAVLAKEATLAHGTYGLAALNTDLDALLTRLTAPRAGYLDNLNTGVPLSAAGVDAILDEVVEGGLTMRQILRIGLAALAGKSSGGGTATLIFKGADGTTTRITATVDADGNRTAMTVNGD